MPRIDVPFIVQGQHIKQYPKVKIAAGGKNYFYAVFNTHNDDPWGKIGGIKASFRCDGIDPIIMDVVRGSGNSLECPIPWEVMAKIGYFDTGMFGGDRIPTTMARTFVIEGCICDGDDPRMPTPDWFTSIEQNKLSSNQGTENAGKALVIDEDGNVIPGEVDIPPSDWCAGEGEAGHIKNRTHYYESLYPDSIFPVEINPKELGEGIFPLIATNDPATFSYAFKYERMITDPRLIETYTLDYGVDTQDRSNSGYNFVSKFKLFDDKNYSISVEGGLTIYVVVDASILSDEYKAMFSDVGVYAKVINNSPVIRYSLKLVKFSVTLPEQFIPNMFPRLHGKAEVGQVLQVEKTDYFGNPTKWKAIDVSTDEDAINLLTELQIISPISSSMDDIYISNSGDIYSL